MSIKNLQQLVADVIPSLGGYWPTEEICLRLCEETGEVCQARRKGTKDDMRRELTDVFFTVLCLANVLNSDLETELLSRLSNFKYKASTLEAERKGTI